MFCLLLIFHTPSGKVRIEGGREDGGRADRDKEAKDEWAM